MYVLIGSSWVEEHLLEILLEVHDVEVDEEFVQAEEFIIIVPGECGV